ncbi:MAG TPA: hypothetical protein VIQ30_24750 [Pseudonocardia sp.]
MRGSRARAYSLTEAGYRITDLMRAGAVSTEGTDAKRGVPAPRLGRCPVCLCSMWATPAGLVRAHSWEGRECRGTGREVARG